MAQYHMTADGSPALCRASKRACPRGDAEGHCDAATVEQARVWAESVLQKRYEQSWENTYRTLSTKQRNALNAYQGPKHDVINGMLRGRDIAPDLRRRLKARVATLDSIIEQSLTVPPETLYRVVMVKDAFLAETLAPGTVMIEPGYLSTSGSEAHVEENLLDFKIAANSPMGLRSKEPIPVLFHIDVPAMKKCLGPEYFDQDSEYLEEDEYLFGRDTALEVISDRDEDGVRTVRARMLGA